MIFTLLRLVPCLAILLAAGCSSFDRRFEEASRAPAKEGSLAGAYSGRWASLRNSTAGGNLRCILIRLENVPCGHAPRGSVDYRADFRAKWHGFSSEHVVVLHTKPGASRGKHGALDFTGTSKLRMPIGAGTYSCEGSMDPRQMRARYDAMYDQGTFELDRVTPKDASR